MLYVLVPPHLVFRALLYCTRCGGTRTDGPPKHIIQICFYFISVPGFSIFSNDKERAGEAKDELMRMLAEDELRDAVLLIFANKQVLLTSMLSVLAVVGIYYRLFPPESSETVIPVPP